MSKYPEIDSMRWSYSRVSTHDDCPYRWFLQYIYKAKDADMFYASYGKFIHELIDGYYKGIYKKEDLPEVFITQFKDNVKGERPKGQTLQKYIKEGMDYFLTFEPFPFDTIATEMEIKFNISGIPFIGYIDYLGKDEDGELVIVDNKSRTLRPRSVKNNLQTDRELDKYLVQLYLYSKGIEEKYGKLPRYLCFNCFRNGKFIKERFYIQKYEEALKWATDAIETIKEADDFPPDPSFFKCKWLCGVSEECDFK